MRRYIAGRLATGLLAVFVVSMLVFAASRLTGNPVNLFVDPSATEEDRAKLMASLGLDKPWHVQYYIFLKKAILHGDLGRSITFERPVTEVIFSKLWNTLQLGGIAFCLSISVSVVAGVIAAVRRSSWWDWFVRGFVFFGQALPSFWLGIMLILIFAVKLDLVTPAGKAGPATFVLPVITLAWPVSAGMTRLIRSSMLDVLSSDYIRTARSKGLNDFAVVQSHALKNALIPAVTYSGIVLVRQTIVGSIVVETVFGWPGIGRLAFEATFARDYPVVQGLVVIIASIVIIVNLGVEILYGLLDPRIRHE